MSAGHTVSVGVLPTTVPVLSNQLKSIFDKPFGVKRQASILADQSPVFLPGGLYPKVPVPSWIPITALPLFHEQPDGLSST